MFVADEEGTNINKLLKLQSLAGRGILFSSIGPALTLSPWRSYTCSTLQIPCIETSVTKKEHIWPFAQTACLLPSIIPPVIACFTVIHPALFTNTNHNFCRGMWCRLTVDKLLVAIIALAVPQKVVPPFCVPPFRRACQASIDCIVVLFSAQPVIILLEKTSAVSYYKNIPIQFL